MDKVLTHLRSLGVSLVASRVKSRPMVQPIPKGANWESHQMAYWIGGSWELRDFVVMLSKEEAEAINLKPDNEHTAKEWMCKPQNGQM